MSWLVCKSRAGIVRAESADGLVDDVDTEDNWLENIPNDFNRLTRLVTEDLVKPTESLISLLYQSVSIRDSRHSLQLGVSSTFLRVAAVEYL